MTYVKIGGGVYPAAISGTNRDSRWGDRKSKEITLGMSHAEAEAVFVDGLAWSILYQEPEYVDEQGQTVTPAPVEYDNSDYDLAGPITDNRDGTVSVKMGQRTGDEKAAAAEAALAELDAAYLEGVASA